MKAFETVERQPSADARKSRPGGVPAKFDTNGHVRPFPGNTIIAHLDPDSGLHVQLMKLYRELDAKEHEGLYTLLPPSSWHMTVFEGVCDQVRQPGFWPADLAPDAPLDKCHASFTEKLLAFDMQLEPPFQLSVVEYIPRVDGIGLHLQPGTPAETSRLRGLRDRLSETLQIRHPTHETYAFHLSIAYFIRFPTDQERDDLDATLMNYMRDFPREFELGAPEFCLFDNMFEFRRQFYLK